MLQNEGYCSEADDTAREGWTEVSASRSFREKGDAGSYYKSLAYAEPGQDL